MSEMPDKEAPSIETTKIELSNVEWVDLGPGPMMIGSNDGNFVYSIDDFEPRHEKQTGFSIITTMPPIEIRTKHRVWAMCSSVHPTTLFVAPL